MADFIPLSHHAGVEIKWQVPSTLKETRVGGFLRGEFRGGIETDENTVYCARWHTRVGNSTALHGAEPTWVIERRDARSKTIDVLVNPAELSASLRGKLNEEHTLPQHAALAAIQTRPCCWEEPGHLMWISGELRDFLVKALQAKEQLPLTSSPQEISPRTLGPQIWQWVEEVMPGTLKSVHFQFSPEQNGFDLLLLARTLGNAVGKNFEEALLDPTRSIGHEALGAMLESLERRSERRNLLQLTEKLDPEAALRLCVYNETGRALGRDGTRLLRRRVAPEPKRARALVVFGSTAVVTAATSVFCIRAARFFGTDVDAPSIVSPTPQINADSASFLITPKGNRWPVFRTAQFWDGFSVVDSWGVPSEVSASSLAGFSPGEKVVPALFISPLCVPLESQRHIAPEMPFVHNVVSTDRGVNAEFRFLMRSAELEAKLLSDRPIGIVARLPDTSLYAEVERIPDISVADAYFDEKTGTMSVWVHFPHRYSAHLANLAEELHFKFWHSSIQGDGSKNDEATEVVLREYVSEEEREEATFELTSSAVLPGSFLSPRLEAEALLQTINQTLIKLRDECNPASYEVRRILAQANEEETSPAVSSRENSGSEMNALEALEQSLADDEALVPPRGSSETSPQWEKQLTRLAVILDGLQEAPSARGDPLPKNKDEVVKTPWEKIEHFIQNQGDTDGIWVSSSAQDDPKAALTVLESIRSVHSELGALLSTLVGMQAESAVLLKGTYYRSEYAWLQDGVDRLLSALYWHRLLEDRLRTSENEDD